MSDSLAPGGERLLLVDREVPDGCAACGASVPRWEPVFCCSGAGCGCRGLPINPSLCEDCECLVFCMQPHPNDEEGR